MKRYEVICVGDVVFCFVGKYRKDLETENWHYYEKKDGKLIHFRKDKMVAVEERIYKEMV